MSYNIETNKISEWISNWKQSFDSIAADPSSIKTLVYLVLLERQNEKTSYEDIKEELTNRGVIADQLEDMTLRNAMAQIVKALKHDKLYKIEKSATRKPAFYKLKKRNQSGIREAASNDGINDGQIVSLIINPDPPPPEENYLSMEYIAKRLMQDRRMPFYGIYLPMRAASRWVLYSEKDAQDRRGYEADQCVKLLGEWLEKYRDKDISLIGLGVGEGIGEIEILRRLLHEDYGFKSIHYCAIDTNAHLLLDHVERIRDRFKDEIRKKRLVCGVNFGNFLLQFPAMIKTLRDEFMEKEQFENLLSGFLPQESGTLVSILGNLIGNLEHRASEWSYFQTILEGLKGYDIAFLLGVAVQQKDKEVVIKERYPRDLDDLLLATPKYLTQELEIIKSDQPKGDKEKGEFDLPTDDKEKEERCPTVEEQTYLGDGLVRDIHIEGSIYEFFYRTKWDLSMEIEGKTVTIGKGTALLLYNIIKFDLKSLVDFLRTKGLNPPHDSPDFADKLERLIIGPPDAGREDRHAYAVFAVTNS